jgi:hypothetical protein
MYNKNASIEAGPIYSKYILYIIGGAAGGRWGLEYATGLAGGSTSRDSFLDYGVASLGFVGVAFVAASPNFRLDSTTITLLDNSISSDITTNRRYLNRHHGIPPAWQHNIRLTSDQGCTTVGHER